MDFCLPVDSIASLAGPLTEEQRSLLERYGEAVLDASLRMSIVSRKSRSDLQEHFIDSAAMLSFRDVSRETLGDLGSGAGFPGVVLAVLRPGTDVTLVESRRKKVVFLKSLVRDLDLKNLSVCHARIEELAGGTGFECAVARALGDVEKVLPGCLGTVARGGSLVLFKGPRWNEEARRAERIASRCGFVIARAEAVELPGLGRATTFVEFRRM